VGGWIGFLTALVVLLQEAGIALYFLYKPLFLRRVCEVCFRPNK
jgi:hypothetical protein